MKMEQIVEWVSTALVIVGAVTLSLDMNALSKVAYFTGSIGWVAVGVFWKKPSIIIVNAVILLIFLAGYIK